MIYRLIISYRVMLDKAIAQNSIDFQSLRIQNPAGADAVYDDFVLSTDNAPEAFERASLAAGRLSDRFSSFIRHVELSAEQAIYVFETHNPHTRCDSLSVNVEDYLMNAILSWWYSGRHEEFENRCQILAASALDALTPQLVNMLCSRRLRFW